MSIKGLGTRLHCPPPHPIIARYSLVRMYEEYCMYHVVHVYNMSGDICFLLFEATNKIENMLPSVKSLVSLYQASMMM